MSKQRYISTSFWDDEWVSSLDPSEKLLYLYFMTNPLTTIAGIYEITKRRISFDTGFNIDTLNNMILKFEAEKKLFYHGSWVIIPSWPKHQSWRSKPTIKKGIDKCLSIIPKKVFNFLSENMIPYAYPIHSLLIEHGYDPSYLDLDLDLDLDRDTDIDLDRDKNKNPLSQKKEYGKFVPQEKKTKYGKFVPKDKENKTTTEKPDSKPEKQIDPLSSQITSCIDHWNKKDNLPRCRFNVLTLPEVGAVNNIFNAYGEEDIKAAIDNISTYWDKENFKPASFQRFIVGSLDRWVIDCKPWERYDDSKPGMTKLEKELEQYTEIRDNFKSYLKPDEDLMKQAEAKVKDLERLVKEEKNK